MQNEKRNIEFIQALRGIAALAVVLRHAAEFIPGIIVYDTKAISWMLFWGGAGFGVDLFFIISGFIMVCTTWSGDGSIRYTIEFYIKRFTRIFPVYTTLTLTLISIFTLHGGMAFFDSGSNVNSLFKALLFLPQGDISAKPVYGVAPLFVGWTLNYEMYFYLIFGASLLLGRARWIALATVAVMTLVVLPYLTTGSVTASVYPDYAYSFFYLNIISNPIIWLFIAGVGIALIYKSKVRVESQFWCLILVSTATAFTIYQYLSWYRADHGIFMWGISLVPLVLSLAIASKTIRIPAPHVFTYLGDISFSLYLVHLPVKGALDIVFRYIGAVPEGAPFFVLMVLMSIIAAAISHRYLEQSLANWLKSKILTEFQHRFGKIGQDVLMK
ncbi:acyltransferase family protein [Yokenella regensburgei]|jgi:peptidoglycan/LPS O-acetylase OafA/YrhL|uniref:acyltransferase family protein n=1 Tax=Yokenella regensburgei TaxID=158877 RepID=UPI0028A00567|nr:acyltransferase [Yokenella regensburgei]